MNFFGANPFFEDFSDPWTIGIFTILKVFEKGQYLQNEEDPAH